MATKTAYPLITNLQKPRRLPGGFQGAVQPVLTNGASVMVWLHDGQSLRLTLDNVTLDDALFAIPWSAVDWWEPIESL